MAELASRLRSFWTTNAGHAFSSTSSPKDTTRDRPSHLELRPNGTVLITGASRGLGAALACEFARQGHDLILVARSEKALNEIAQWVHTRHAVRAHVFSCDLAEKGAAQRVADFCSSVSGGVGVLVNNAGQLRSAEVGNHEPGSIRAMIDVNVTALSELTCLLLPSLKQRNRAHIVNISSLASLQPLPKIAVYSATKAYVTAFSDALRQELSGTSVHCLTVLVGPLNTRMLVEQGRRGSPLALASRASSDPETVAQAIYDGCVAGRTRFAPGLLSATLHFGLCTLPRSLSTRIARYIN